METEESKAVMYREMDGHDALLDIERNVNSAKKEPYVMTL